MFVETEADSFAALRRVGNSALRNDGETMLGPGDTRALRTEIRRLLSRGRCALGLGWALLLATLTAHATAGVYPVDRYGAVPDGKTMNTVAIQKAIDDAGAHLSSKGPSLVVFSAGTYLTGSIFVKSGVTLRLDKGVTLLGSQNIADYPMMPTRIAGIEMTWPAALVNVYKQDHAEITGEGTIDGDGKVFWDSYWTLRTAYEPRGLRWASDYDARRPRLVQVFDSHEVKLGGGLLLRRSGFWTLHLCYSDHVTVDGVTIRNNEGGRGPSTDGIDIDSSTHILVAHADIAVNDDALCLKAGRDSDGLRVARPTTDVVLRDSVVRDGAAGVTFGSETSGGFRNIEVYNIKVIEHVPVGILFKSAHTRGGFAEDIRLHDFTLTNIAVVLRVTMNWNPSYSYAQIPAGMTGYPDYWKVLSTHVPDAQGRAHVHDVHLWNITATGAKTGFEVDAYKDAPLERFQLDHWNVQAQTAGHIVDAENWKFSDDVLSFADGSTVTQSDDVDLTGLPTGHPKPLVTDDPAKKSTKEQDKS